MFSCFGHVDQVWAHMYLAVGHAELRPMLGLSWGMMGQDGGYVEQLTKIWPISKNVEKHAILEQKSPPLAKAELAYKPYQKKRLGTFGAGGFGV